MNHNIEFKVDGFLKIYDPRPETYEVFVDWHNSIHYENFSIALANSMANTGRGFISEMVFGNGGSRIDPTGIITYLTPNNTGINAALYNQTYYKIIDATSPFNLNPSRNFMETRHLSGTPYTDILISCLLDYGEPAGQAAFDSALDQDGNFVFDEIGLKGFSPDGEDSGPLLTHAIFHPTQKSLNRLMQIDYTIRIQSISTGV